MVFFTYDNLPIHCVACGRIGHTIEECQICSPEQKKKLKAEQPYGIGLRSDWGGKGVSIFKDLEVKGAGMKSRCYLASLEKTNRAMQEDSWEEHGVPEIVSEIVHSPVNLGDKSMEETALKVGDVVDINHGQPKLATKIGEESQMSLNGNPKATNNKAPRQLFRDITNAAHGDPMDSEDGPGKIHLVHDNLHGLHGKKNHDSIESTHHMHGNLHGLHGLTNHDSTESTHNSSKGDKQRMQNTPNRRVTTVRRLARA